MHNQDTSAALEYHQGTSHPYGHLLSPEHRYHPADQPLLFKIYRGLEPIPLPEVRPIQEADTVSALEAIGNRVRLPPAEITGPSLPALARLLFFSAGITKTIRYPPPWGEIPFRAAACTGALYHIEIYVVGADQPGLSAGVYHFDPQGFALRRLRSGDFREALVAAAGDEPSLARTPAALVLTDATWRNAVKYQARAYRHAFWDSGTILANTLAVAAALHLKAKIVLGFADEAVCRLLDIDPERELPLALVPIWEGQELQPPPAPPATPLGLAVEPYSPRERSFPAILAMHRASSLPDGEAASAWRRKALKTTKTEPARGATGALTGPLIELDPIPEPDLPRESIEAVILRRGSTRRFAREPIHFRQLSTLLLHTSRGFESDFAESPDVQINQVYLIANAVEGLAPGAYVFHRELRALELLRLGDFRDVAGYLGLYQDLAADASADIFFMNHLPAVLERLGNRGYRAAQLAASIAAGRIYLAAYALGFGASGLTFFDDAVTEFFSPHAAGKSVMFLVAIGRKMKQS
jgi:SagB-type dehydrogenase family enzyme